MKYILILIMTMLSVYSTSETIADTNKIKQWVERKPWKRHGVWLAIFLSLWTILCTWTDDKNAHNEKAMLDESVSSARRQIDQMSDRLQEANAQIKSQTELLQKQEQSLFEQSRIVGSIAFNTQTSFEGKRRFINCFRNLARLAKFNVSGTHFEGLICDDGVAVYWFASDTEDMMGFHFFSNAELNKILAGLPDDANLVDDSGNVRVNETSVLGIAMTESLFRKTPIRGNTTLEKEVSYSCIEEELKILFRYVYRAQSVKFSDLYTTGGNLTGDKAIMFQYIVDPFAPEPHLRTVSDIIVKDSFFDSLYDIHMAEFSQKTIAWFRAMGIEPKLRIKDIRILNMEKDAAQRKVCNPFEKSGKGGDR
jgi:hypothetical protein